MADNPPRLTPQTARVLDCLITRSGLSGVEIGRLTGLASGTLYPLLLRLEDARLVSSEWETADPRDLGRPRRRFYSMTNLGLAFVRRAAAAQLGPLSRLASA